MSPLILTAIIVASVLSVLVFLLLFIIAPGRRNMSAYKNVYYAHRGLHDGEKPENSLAAFRAAVEAGFGIELDVRLSSDGVLMVFHDDTLERMVGIKSKVADLTASELSALRLLDSNEGIPTFDEVLDAVGGRVPLLVEIKEDQGDHAVSDATAKRLSSYEGGFIVESFNPLSVRNARKKLPKTPCGFLSCKHKVRTVIYLMLTNLMFNFLCRPDFIAYCHTDSSNIFLRLVRAIFRVPTVAWTVCSEVEERAARAKGFCGIIFEGYVPEG